MAKIVVEQEVSCSLREIKEFYDKAIDVNIDPDTIVQVAVKMKASPLSSGGFPGTESITMSVSR